MKKVKLSICIPVYNRKKELVELLNSIKLQITEEIKDNVEVCISDNCSSDSLIEVVEKFKEFFEINYWKNNKNIGADCNFLKVIDNSTGDYCWYMGSDDIIPKNGILKVLKYIENYSDIGVFLGNRDECDINMQFIKKRYWLSERIKEDRIFNFQNLDQFSEYLFFSEGIGALFSFLSSIILKKSLWEEIENKEKYIGSFYLHAGVVLEILKKSKIMYIHDSIVLCRGENDSFLENFKQRIFLDYKGYLKLAETLENEGLKKEFLLVMKREHPYRNLIVLASLFKLTQEEKEILSKYSYNIIILNLLFNNFSHQILKRLYGGYKKLKNAKTSEK